jgi:hypothetical protein
MARIPESILKELLRLLGLILRALSGRPITATKGWDFITGVGTNKGLYNK